MRSLLTRQRLILILVILFVLGVLAAVLCPKSPPQFVTLSDGDKYEFADATYGADFTPPSLSCKIANSLPSGLRKVAVRLLGDRMAWQIVAPFNVPTTNRSVLVVWFRHVPANRPPASSIMGLPSIWLGDQNNFSVMENAGGSHLAISFLGKTNGWWGEVFTVAPRRSPILNMNLFLDSNRTERITFRNPVYGKYPQWQPKDTLPATNDFPDLHVRIDPLTRGDEISSNYHFRPRTIITKETYTDWTVTDAELSDATGNTLPRWNGTWFFSGPQTFEQVEFAGALWPGEDAWRLKFQLSKSNGVSHTVELFIKPPY